MESLRTPAFTATGLGAFLDCSHRTVLDLLALEGQLARPGQNEIERLLLARRGLEHERRVLSHYQSQGLRVVEIPPSIDRDARDRAVFATEAAMESGADVIYQGVLTLGSAVAKPDFLVKVAARSQRWPHHYEVVDAKLAERPRAAAVLQLCVYTERLAEVQGTLPERFHIAAGHASDAPLPLRTLDYYSYYRQVKQRYAAFLEGDERVTYPEPVEHCDVCPWWKRCDEQRRRDDHLSLVANITRRQRDRLGAAGVTTVRALGELPMGAEIDGVDTLPRLREQARLQRLPPSYRLLLDADRTPRDGQPTTLVGLEALPAPKPGDLFLDLEGDAFVDGGIEYLFGLLELGEPLLDDFSVRDSPGEPRYHAYWASTRAEEKRAFEAVIDRIVRGRQEFPALHVFHFGHRESDALKKLSCRHKTREHEVDTLLREHVLIDLHPIVRHAVIAGVEGYTLKQLEPLHGFRRGGELREAAQAMQLYGWWLETGDETLPLSELRERIEAYNRDDCFSTWSLRDFLERLRLELEQLTGRPARRPTSEAEPRREDSERQRATAEVARQLTGGLPEDPAHDTPEQKARRLMADLLDWHWREAKSGYWEYFRARDLAPDDRLADRTALGGLSYEGVVGEIKRSNIHRYTFPEQEHAIRRTPEPIDPDTEKPAGEVMEVGLGHIHLKRGKTSALAHPLALIPGRPLESKDQADALLALGRSLLGGVQSLPAAVAQLLARQPPALGQSPGAPLLGPDEPIDAALSRIAHHPGGLVLAVQGPPGSGKTYQAARLILSLLASGLRVGVTANSHSVICGVLEKSCQLAAADGSLRAVHLRNEDESTERYSFPLEKNKKQVLERLRTRELHLVGGTAWTWASEDFRDSVDVLVVDEAGQISLANVLAVARAARTLVLVGDPAQLEQPQKGVHPPGADVSALEHLLGGNALTIPGDLGLFLPSTRRMHPEICEFVSNAFYEGRLRPIDGLERQRVDGARRCSGSGLRYVPVAHRGNTNCAPEEIEVARALLADWGLDQAESSPFATFTDCHGNTRPLTQHDVLVVAPYNAQVAALRRALPRNVRVGTVDKFQGREAAIVVYSLASSSAEDAPRGLEFLLSPNRLNVAVSRAQALSVLLASPALTHATCKTPRQMKLVNALCAYLDRATEI